MGQECEKVNVPRSQGPSLQKKGGAWDFCCWKIRAGIIRLPHVGIYIIHGSYGIRNCGSLWNRGCSFHGYSGYILILKSLRNHQNSWVLRRDIWKANSQPKSETF